MKKLFVPYNESLIFRQLGFDELCLATYQTDNEDLFFVDGFQAGVVDMNDGITNSQIQDVIVEEEDEEGNIYSEFTAPTWEQAFDWLDQHQNIHACVRPTFSDADPSKIVYTYYIINRGADFTCMEELEDKQQANLLCLQHALRLCAQDNGPELSRGELILRLHAVAEFEGYKLVGKYYKHPDHGSFLADKADELIKHHKSFDWSMPVWFECVRRYPQLAKEFQDRLHAMNSGDALEFFIILSDFIIKAKTQRDTPEDELAELFREARKVVAQEEGKYVSQNYKGLLPKIHKKTK